MEATIRATGWERAIKVVLVCFCAWFAGAAGLSAQQDKILLKNGKDRQVRIKSEDFDGVRYTTQATGTAEQRVSWSEIDSIEYSGGKDFQDAMATFGAGRWTDALAKFEGVVTKSEGEGDDRRVQIIPVRRG